MLETPRISHYCPALWRTNAKYSDNVQSAGNQQERLISIGWVIGFVDGEGCFSLGVVRQPDRARRRGYTTGYQIFHEFAVTQGARSLGCLEKLRQFFGVGAIYLNTRYDQPSRAPVPLHREETS